MTQFPDLFADLSAPFESQEVRARSQAGRQLHYITARTAMNRLDSVLGPENWWDDYTPGENSVLCRLTVRLPDGSILTKADAGGYAGMPDSGDDDKSGFSDSFKRAAVKFGVGRYLYRDGVPTFAREREPGKGDAAEPPVVPTPPPAPAIPDRRPRGYHSISPQDGRQLYAWSLKEGKHHKVDLIRKLAEWAKPHGFPPLIGKWDAAQVAEGFARAVEFLDELRKKRGAA